MYDSLSVRLGSLRRRECYCYGRNACLALCLCDCRIRTIEHSAVVSVLVKVGTLEIINLSALNKFEDGEIVTAEALLAKGILSKCEYGYKVLGNGTVTKKVTVQAAAFSQSAKEAIEAAGGKAEVI